jgi:glycosyltransferase involved in cell wall biosynthesis
MNKNMISIIVPIYNSNDTITKCIESILKQSFTDIELILVNDGSTDGSGKICDEYAEKDSRVTVIHQSNKGRTAARWAGVEACVGEWISFVDSDDTLPVNALENLYKAATDEVDIVLGNGYSLAPESRKTIPIDEFRHMAVRADGTIGVPWGSLYRKSVITSYLFDIPRHIYNGEDYIFWLRLVFSTHKPVNIVYESVYHKGEEHTSNSFHWTAAYCYELNELRKSAIPAEEYDIYLPDMLQDRLVNMFAVASCCAKKEWIHSPYYQELIKDMKAIGRPMTFKHKMYFHLPSRLFRNLYSWLSNKNH